jgi:hypothetical protein
MILSQNPRLIRKSYGWSFDDRMEICYYDRDGYRIVARDEILYMYCGGEKYVLAAPGGVGLKILLGIDMVEIFQGMLDRADVHRHVSFLFLSHTCLMDMDMDRVRLFTHTHLFPSKLGFTRTLYIGQSTIIDLLYGKVTRDVFFFLFRGRFLYGHGPFSKILVHPKMNQRNYYIEKEHVVVRARTRRGYVKRRCVLTTTVLEKKRVYTWSGISIIVTTSRSEEYSWFNTIPWGLNFILKGLKRNLFTVRTFCSALIHAVRMCREDGVFRFSLVFTGTAYQLTFSKVLKLKKEPKRYVGRFEMDDIRFKLISTPRLLEVLDNDGLFMHNPRVMDRLIRHAYEAGEDISHVVYELNADPIIYTFIVDRYRGVGYGPDNDMVIVG